MTERRILFGSDGLPSLEEQLHAGDYIKFFYSPFISNGRGYLAEGTFRRIGPNLFKNKCIIISVPFSETLLEVALDGFSHKAFRRKYEIDGITGLVVLE